MGKQDTKQTGPDAPPEIAPAPPNYDYGYDPPGLRLAADAAWYQYQAACGRSTRRDDPAAVEDRREHYARARDAEAAAQGAALTARYGDRHLAA